LNVKPVFVNNVPRTHHSSDYRIVHLKLTKSIHSPTYAVRPSIIHQFD